MKLERIKIVETEYGKTGRSKNYNFNFNKIDGSFMRWGQTKDDDPEFGYPEILDLEISEICNMGCKFCYKSNVEYSGRNMTLDTFKIIVSKMPKTITQIAFGIGDIDTNPDLADIIRYSRNHGIIPNLTINGSGLTDWWADFFSEWLGAIAVSIYDKNLSFNAIEKLTSRGMKQVNVHFMISKETKSQAIAMIDHIKSDPRLKKMNALVFLSLKPKGRGETFHALSQDEFNEIVNYAIRQEISMGFDSCSAPKYLECIKNDLDFKEKEQLVEPCESGLFSSYINVAGEFFPCSFAENHSSWTTGIDVIHCDTFLQDVWSHPRVIEWKKNLLKNCRNCPIYNV